MLLPGDGGVGNVDRGGADQYTEYIATVVKTIDNGCLKGTLIKILEKCFVMGLSRILARGSDLLVKHESLHQQWKTNSFR